MEEQKINSKNMLGFEVALEDLGKKHSPKQLGTSDFKLDVGCGVVGSGDVNCDLYVNDGSHRLTSNRIDAKRIKNFVMCDSQHLPFKDNAFDWVYSSHVVEHVKEPFEMLKEMVRVSSLRVTVKCPHRFERLTRKYNPHHINFFGVVWMRNAFKALRCECVVSVNYMPFPTSVFSLLNIPVEMCIESITRTSPEIKELMERAGTDYTYRILLKGDWTGKQ